MDWAGSLVRQYSSLQSRNSYYQQQQQLQQLHQRPLEEEEEEEEEEESSDEEVHKLHIENELLKAELEAYQRENEELKAGSGAAVTKSNKKCAPRKRKRAAVAAIESDEESGTNSNTENDQENDDDDEHSSPSPPGRKKKPSSTFGANQSPITTPFGLIDGRSNSQASFEEKIRLLQEFKDEFNHLRVPEKPSNPRYRRLAKFLDKQRQHYRKYVAGDTSVPIWPERVEMLDNLGVWLLLPGEQRWEESYPKLVEFHKTYGHCCVSAIRSICQDQPEFVQWVRSIRSSFRGYEYKQQKLQKSLNEQRAADEQQQRQLQKEKEQDDENAEGETTTTEETASEVNQEKTDNSTNNNSSDANNNASGINGDTAATTATAVTTAPNNVAGTVAVAAATTASPKDIAALIANRTQLTQAEIKAAAYAYATGSINARPENQTGAISRTTLTVREAAIKRREEKAAAKQAAKEAAEEAERAKKEAFRNENIKIPQWYTDERHEMLKRFNCAWLSGFEFTAAANNTKGIGTLARTCWYANIERLKAFQKDHPDDFILIWGTPKEERTRLQKWILKQRKIYKHVMVTKTIPVNPVLEDQFKLLQEDYNIILHPDMVQAKEDEDRIKRETDIIKAEEDVKWKASAQYKLETALQTQSDAKAQVAVAKFQLEEAEKFLRKVQREFASARTEVKEAQEIVDADPVGKMVTVKPRGGNRGSGLARILAITKSTVLGSDLLFYDLEFVPTEENGGEAKKELFVDGVFVTPIVTPGTAPAVAPAFVVEVPPPRKAPRVMTTRGRAKKSPKELLEVTI